MKKLIFISTLFFVIASAHSQQKNDNPNSNWPYLFAEFSPCLIVHKDGNTTKVNANYNLLNELLQYSNKGEIMDFSDPGDIASISFDGLKMAYVAEAYYVRLTDENDKINCYKKIKGNINDLIESTGAYGSSTTTAAVTQQTEINIGGINSMDIRMLWDNKKDGKKFRVNEYYFFATKANTELVPLKKNSLLEAFPKNEKEIKSFIKANKINFKEDNEILALTEFVSKL